MSLVLLFSGGGSPSEPDPPTSSYGTPLGLLLSLTREVTVTPPSGGGVGAGSPIGLLLALTYAGSATTGRRDTGHWEYNTKNRKRLIKLAQLRELVMKDEDVIEWLIINRYL